MNLLSKIFLDDYKEEEDKIIISTPKGILSFIDDKIYLGSNILQYNLNYTNDNSNIDNTHNVDNINNNKDDINNTNSNTDNNIDNRYVSIFKFIYKFLEENDRIEINIEQKEEKRVSLEEFNAWRKNRIKEKKNIGITGKEYFLNKKEII
ncbi:hypothetical protein SLOPH_834 [Spraguea lophii 42_110]|uniref:Uncharacterized protein n=1 Tax=Spraguea lophii (strain 42_110) TaxID=1358809 RepID=S7W8T4_SPRLO|nr:hypothetical protein SLOPH_834 [Spraguea lophii 42_110]